MERRNRFGALSLSLNQIRRQLSAQPAVVFTLLVTVLISTILLGATPRLLEEVSSEDLTATVSEPDPARRNIAIERLGRLAPGPADDPLVRIAAFGEDFEQRAIPVTVQDVISDSYYLFETPQFTVSPLPNEDPPHPFDTFLRMTYQEGIENEMQLVAGHLPEPKESIPMLVGHSCPIDAEDREELFELISTTEDPPTDADGNVIDCSIEDISHYEIAVSAKTAEDMGLEVGRQMLLEPDGSDPLFFGLPVNELDYQLVMSISGIVEFSDPEMEYWYGDIDLHRPRVQENADLRIIYATGLVNPRVYTDLFRDVGLANHRYIYRQFVSPELVGDADLGTLITDLREFETHYTPVVARPNDPRVITQLSTLLDDHLEQRRQTISMMSTTIASLFVVAMAVILMLAVLMTSRQRNSIIYLRNRGASRGQLTLTRVYEGAILVVPAAVLGYLIAELQFVDTEDLLSYRITVALATTSILVIVSATWQLIRSPLGQLQRSSPVDPRETTRRLVAEILVISLAVGTIILLRRRGSIQDPVETSFDWLLAAAPALLSVAVALVTVRVFPYVMRVMAWVAAQFRGLVGFIGFKRLLNRSSGGFVSISVILICVSVAAFASVAATSVRQGQVVSSYQAVGADYTVTANVVHANIPLSVDISDLTEIESVAAGTSYDRARLVQDGNDLPTEVLAIDADDYQTVVGGTFGDVALPKSMTGLPRPGEGTDETPMPALVSRDWPTSFQPELGDIVTIDMGRLNPTVEVVEIRDRFPDVPQGRPFVVLNRRALAEFSELPVANTVLYLRASSAAGETIQSRLADQASSAELTSRYDVIDAFRDDPFVGWVQRGFSTVFAFAGVFALVSIVSALALASAQRRIDLGLLRTLGLNGGQATWLTIIEQLPGVLVATALGMLTGVGVAVTLDPALEYDAFTGNLVPTAVTVDWLSLATLSVALFAALSAAIVIFVLVNRDQDLGQTLRVGDE